MFPAMELRLAFDKGDLNYLANLCHGCGACFDDCQFAPPHEFYVDVPATLGKLRAETYANYAWPSFCSGLFARNELTVSLAAALGVAGFFLGFAAYHGADGLFASGSNSDFYRVMPHAIMAVLFSAVFLFAILAMTMSVRRFWKDISLGAPRLSSGDFWQAFKDAGKLRYLDGGNAGCTSEGEGVPDRRRIFHHLAFYGFFLCFAATVAGTIYHYAFGKPAPYVWYELPVLLGTLGGIGLIIGPVGLLAEKRKQRAQVKDGSRFGMDTAFTTMLLFNGASGLALLVFRDTGIMGALLALHLGFVFALFLTMPYGKFMHGLYRYAALVRYAQDISALRRP